jgi:hypothetical protein
MAKLKHWRGSSGVFGREGAPILALDARIEPVAMNRVAKETSAGFPTGSDE